MTTHRTALLAAAGLMASALTALSTAPPAHADVDPATAVTALGAPAGVTAALSGSSATASAVFNDFPSQGSDYLLLSTGDAGQVFPAVADPQAQLSTDRGSDGQPDTTTLTLTVQPAAGVGCLFLDFALGTEEPVHTYTTATPSDTLSIQRAGDTSEYAMNAGRGYFSQTGWPAKPTPYAVNALDYWHQPGDPSDPITGSTEQPRLPELTALNHVTTRDTARVPLAFAGGAAETVTVTVSDAGNGDLDSVAFLDHLRLGATCGAGTGVEPNPAYDGGVIGGIRGVGNELWYDPIPGTTEIERYDDPAVGGNGWRSPSGVPVELRFRWYRAAFYNANNGDMTQWTAIPDADRQSYVPGPTDKGSTLIVMVTGIVDGRRAETFPSTGTANSWYATLAIGNGTFVDGDAPVIAGPADGDATVGETLTAQIGHAVPREDNYTWQWYADGAAISGATGQSLVLGSGQAEKTITVRATAHRLSFNDKEWPSAPYGPIKLQGWTSTSQPTVVDDGTPSYGETVIADPGAGWVPTPASYSYQWRRNGDVIAGATSSSYTIKAADVGNDLTVAVSGVKTGYLQEPRTSPAVHVLGATMTGATPTITGTAQVGQILSGVVADWAPADANLTYTWYADGTQLQTGTSHFLTVPPSAVGHSIVLEVTGTLSGYQTLTRSSEPTAVVVPGKLTTVEPKVYGVTGVGYTLSAYAGTWGPSGVKLAYRWKIGSHVVTGRAGSGTEFKIPRTARGKRITVTVTGTLKGYKTVKRVSAPTAKVTG
ncbi:MAG TPA: hypothetical protein VNS55_14265 [Nocardioides sp.]|nr:hypothetical protein [Nocardioides sp.]